MYKSVPPPRQLGDPVLNGTGTGTGTGRLSGSDPMLASQEIQLHSSKFPVSILYQKFGQTECKSWESSQTGCVGLGVQSDGL